MDRSQGASPITILGISIWLLASLFYLYEYFLRTFIGTVAHQVIPDLHLNAETFAIVGAAYYVAYGLMQIPVGILADKFGVKILMIFATLICVLGTFFFAHSNGFFAAFASRMLMGFGSSFAFVCLLVIALTWFPKEYFGFFVGCSNFIGSMGPLLAGGPLMAAMMVMHETWRSVMSQIGLFGLILAVLILFIVRNKGRGGENELVFLDRSTSISARFKQLFKNKQAWYIAVYSAMTNGPIALVGAVWGTEYLQARGLTQLAAADMISLAWFALAVSCPLLGAFSDIAKRRRPTIIFCALIGLISTAGLTFLPASLPHGWYGPLLVGLGIASAGNIIGFAMITEQVRGDARATALGFNNALLILTSAVIPPFASYFIMLSAGDQSTHLRAQDFTVAFTIMPIFYVVALILSLIFIKETFCRPQKEAIRLVVGQ